ncbi:MAG TPA: DUF4148 domain-containing protein, partial [Rubrivivax sp.]|nr:DUF4148 domain-containing protein [Rubrivivax sp.]
MKNQLSFIVYPAIVVLSLAAAVSAHAESPTLDDTSRQVWAQSKTSDQVRSELLQARTDGTTKVWSISYNPLHKAQSLKSREELRAEVLTVRAEKKGNALLGEDSGSFSLA